MVKLSIIIPVYNIKKDYLNKCFYSLSRQSMENIEFIVVDDGSVNECAVLCDNFKNRESRAVVIHQKNSGVSVARNTGLSVAQGEYVLFVDADDSLLDDCCNKLCKFMDTNDFDILFFKYITESNRDNFSSLGQDNKIIELTYKKTHELCCEIIARSQDRNQYTLGAPWGKIFRRSFIEKNNVRFVIGLKKAQDRVFMLDCLIKEPRVAFVDIFGYCYNDINLESVCHRFNPNILTTLEMLDSEMVRVVEQNAVASDEFSRAIGMMRLQNILEYLHLYEFHPDNLDSKETKKKRLIKLIRKDIYSNALNDVSYKQLRMFDKQRQIKLILLKNRWINLYVSLSLLGRKVKSHS